MKRTWKNPNKSTVFLIFPFCDFYGKLPRFGLSLFHPASQFLLAFFLCCSAPPLYKLKIIEFFLIHLILVPSGIVAILLFLHLWDSSIYCFSEFQPMIWFANTSVIFSWCTCFRITRKAGVSFWRDFLLYRETTKQFNFNWWPNGLESKLPKSLMEAIFPFLNANTGMKLNSL